MGCPPLKNEAPPTEKQPPLFKSEVPFQEMIPRKKIKKSKTVINTCVSLIKKHRNSKINIILSLGAFKILHRKPNSLLENIILLD